MNHTSVELRCCKLVFGGGDFRGHSCGLKATVEREGKQYCRVHDPESVAKRKKERSAKWAAEDAVARKHCAIEKARHAICDAAIAYVDENGSGVDRIALWERIAESVAALHKIESGE